MASTLHSTAASALLASLPRVLSVGLQEYAERFKNGDVAAAATNARDHLVVTGYRGRLSSLADVDGFCGSLIEALVSDAGDFGSSWLKLLEVCEHVPPVAGLVVKVVKEGRKDPREIVSPSDVDSLHKILPHITPRQRYTDLLLRRLQSMADLFLSFDKFVPLAQAVVEELSGPECNVFPVRGRPSGMEASLKPHPSGGMLVRVDSMDSPEFWAESVIPVDALRRFL
jgi:hypothetical protein